jgi:hypothetical protein
MHWAWGSLSGLQLSASIDNEAADMRHLRVTFQNTRAHRSRLAKNSYASWGYDNTRWTMGTTDIDETKKACAAYTLAPIAPNIRQHVLILAGTEDHFIPFHQTADFEAALVNARSVTTRIFDRASGGAQHCQNGSITLVHAAILIGCWQNSELRMTCNAPPR